MNNIWIEGLQGSGKSTLARKITQLNPGYRLCTEGDYSPVELAWCTWMTKEQYEDVLKRYEAISEEIKAHTVQEGAHYIVTYTKILTDIPGFHRELEQYEIYNGRRSLTEIKEIVLARYQAFRDTGHVFECSFLQNLVEDMILFHLLSDDEIVELYGELYAALDQDNFRLLYLYGEDMEGNIRAISKERADTHGNPIWYPLMMEYFMNSPYGKKHNANCFEDLIAHFKHRQELELRILKEVVGEQAIVLRSREWSEEEIVKLIQ